MAVLRTSDVEQSLPQPRIEQSSHGRPVQSLVSIVNRLQGLELTVTSTLFSGRFSGVVHFFDTKEILKVHDEFLPRVCHFVIQP